MRGMAKAAAAMLLLALAPGVRAQEANILLPVDRIEAYLARDSIEVIDRRASRGIDGERTSRTAVQFPDGTMLVVKWARAAPGGHEFNNAPRFELAAYQLQKLFLEEDEYVVPPTVARAFPTDLYSALDPEDTDRTPTLRGTRSVLVVLQYWLYNVTPEGFWDPDRFTADSVYARHAANFNILTYLVRHGDDNTGNFLVSSAAEGPRVFSVDNGVAFSSRNSDRGHSWRRLQVDRLPAATVERLRSLTFDELTRRLETVAEFRVDAAGLLEPVDPGKSLNGRIGVRRAAGRVQLGLTRQEIAGVWSRMRQLLDRVDSGSVGVF